MIIRSSDDIRFILLKRIEWYQNLLDYIKLSVPELTAETAKPTLTRRCTLWTDVQSEIDEGQSERIFSIFNLKIYRT